MDNDISREINIEQVEFGIDIDNIEYSIEINPRDTFAIELNEQGPQGARGYTGNGISSYELTSTVGLVDTYTITFTDGETTTVNVTNGKGITSITGPVSVGNVDTYTINYNDSTTSTFAVTNGIDGVNPTVTVGSTTTGNPGTNASVVNSGTTQDVILDFTIPRGDKGETGEDGTDGFSPIVTVSKVGDTATISITDINGTTTTTISDGTDGTDGAAATITVGTVTTGLPTDPASVTNVGTSSAAVFDFTIPKGDKGDTGATGQGVIPGGTTGQVLAKKTNTDYDTEWVTMNSATWGNITGTLSDQTDLKNALDLTLRTKSTAGTGAFVDSRAGNATYPTTGAHLTNSILIGNEVKIVSDTSNISNTIAIGSGAQINTGANTITLVGASAQATGNNAVVYGYDAKGTGTNAVAIGTSCNVSGSNSLAIGNYTTAASTSSVVVGYGAVTTPTNSVAVGCQSIVNTGSTYGTVLGSNATISQYSGNSIAIGASAKVNTYCSNSIAIGRNATVAQGGGCIQLGTGTNTTYGSFQVKDWTLLNSSGIIPSERLPLEASFATNIPFQLYNIEGMDDPDNDNKEYAILYTGETNSVFTQNLCYKSVVNYSYPLFNCTWINDSFCKSTKDIIIDQQKFFQKLAEVSQERINNDDLANSIVGGDNSSQDIYFYYNGNSQKWYINFGSDGFESGSSQTPDNITDISDISEYGIYLSPNVTLPTDDSDEEIFDVEYYAPIYVDGLNYGSDAFRINYMKFMNEMQDSDWGFNYVDEFDSWSYEVDGTTYNMPILPKEYYTDDGITIKFQYDNYNDWCWHEFINGDELEYDWSDQDLEDKFGIYIDNDGQRVEYIEITFKPARQLRWEQFNPIDDSLYALASQLTPIETDITNLKTWTVQTVTGTKDLNDYKTDGWYKFTGTVTNAPTAVSTPFLMLVLKNASNDIKQFIFAENVNSSIGGSAYNRYAPSIFARSYLFGTWNTYWQTYLNNYSGNFLSNFSESAQQKLIHTANSPLLQWVADTGGGSATYDNVNERITWS